jgi:hypothetical protein
MLVVQAALLLLLLLLLLLRAERSTYISPCHYRCLFWLFNMSQLWRMVPSADSSTAHWTLLRPAAAAPPAAGWGYSDAYVPCARGGHSATLLGRCVCNSP